MLGVTAGGGGGGGHVPLCPPPAESAPAYYPFLNTQQGGIQNSRLIRHAKALSFVGKMDVKIFLMFIVAENTGSVNIQDTKQSEETLNTTDETDQKANDKYRKS